MTKSSSCLWLAGLTLIWGPVLLATPGRAAGLDPAPPLVVTVRQVPPDFRQGGLEAADLRQRLENLAREAGLTVLEPAGGQRGQETRELVLSLQGVCRPDRLCSLTLRLELSQGSRPLETVEVTEPIGRSNVQQVRRLVRGLFERLTAGGRGG